MTEHNSFTSPLLDHCPETLPASAYYDPDWFERERQTIWARNWICAGRIGDVAPGTMRRFDLAGRKLIRCPYHAWSYDTGGRLVSTAYATPTADFRKEDHGLFPVHVRTWNGFVFLCLSDTPPDLAPDLGLAALDNWPMEDLRGTPTRQGNRVQLEGFLGELQRMPALPRHSSRTVRYGAGLPRRDHVARRGRGLERRQRETIRAA